MRRNKKAEPSGLIERTKQAVTNSLRRLGRFLFRKLVEYSVVAAFIAGMYQYGGDLWDTFTDKVSNYFHGGKQQVTRPVTPAPQRETIVAKSTEAITAKLAPPESAKKAFSPPPEIVEAVKPSGALSKNFIPEPLRSIFSSKQEPLTKEQIFAKIEAHTDNDPIPYELIKRLIKSENGKLDTTAVSDSNAVGLGQHMPQTFLEYLYKSKNLLPPSAQALAEYVEPKEKGYGFKAGTGKRLQEKIYALRENPDVSIITTREYVREVTPRLDENFRTKLAAEIRYLKSLKKSDTARIKEMEKNLTRKLNNTDVKWGYVLGGGDKKKPLNPGGGAEILAAHADPAKRKRLAKEFADPAAVAANPSVFKTNGKDLTVGEAYDKMSKYMGLDPLPSDMSLTPDQIDEHRMTLNSMPNLT